MSIVEICNLALARIGNKPIQHLEEGSPAANYCNRFYHQGRRATLRAHQWNFATRTAALARLDETPSGFDYAYQLPNDCLRVIRVVGGDTYCIRGQSLLCDNQSITIEYVGDITDPNWFDDQFVEALSYRLAADLAISLAGKPDLQGNMLQMFARSMPEAMGADAAEGHNRKETNPYMSARR